MSPVWNKSHWGVCGGSLPGHGERGTGWEAGALGNVSTVILLVSAYPSVSTGWFPSGLCAVGAH